MIDIVVNEKKPESRAEELYQKYRESPIRESNCNVRTATILRDISVTMAMILDEMRGVKDGEN